MLDSTDEFQVPQPSLVAADVAELHAHCGVYTNRSFASMILDEIGWTCSVDLVDKRLLEPAAGDGVFLVEAARRLLDSLDRTGTKPSVKLLLPCIRAFELHAGEGNLARCAVAELLVQRGLSSEEANRVAQGWLTIGDFLLHDLKPDSFTHVAGNPPYARWSKIPFALRSAYQAALPKNIAKGDIFLPFLARGIDALVSGGRLGFLCSDRWKYMAFASDFRANWLPSVRIVRNEEVRAGQAYQRAVDIYPSVLVIEKQAKKGNHHSSLSGRSLAELGFEIRVGPALGCTPAYVLGPADAQQVEEELLAPWLNSSDVCAGTISDTGLQIICLYDNKGELRDLEQYPKAKAWLTGFRERLSSRSVVRKQGAIWYRPIDRVFASAWAAPKLLIPELSKFPRIALDRSGAVPSHGLYAIFAKDPAADLASLYAQLAGGGLARLLDGKAPKVKGEYWRCYKNILREVRL